MAIVGNGPDEAVDQSMQLFTSERWIREALSELGTERRKLPHSDRDIDDCPAVTQERRERIANAFGPAVIDVNGAFSNVRVEAVECEAGIVDERIESESVARERLSHARGRFSIGNVEAE